LGISYRLGEPFKALNCILSHIELRNLTTIENKFIEPVKSYYRVDIFFFNFETIVHRADTGIMKSESLKVQQVLILEHTSYKVYTV